MKLYLGVDGGQSSTVALIGDAQGRVIGYSTGGPCNHVSTAEVAAKLTRVIGGCISEACDSAGLVSQTTRFHSACCGMSGGSIDKQNLLSKIIQADRLIVKTDGETALTGALAGKPGIVVIAGTGSIAYGRNGCGTLLRSGGWGYVFGDEGSAFDIVRQAVRASLRYEEGWGVKTALVPALLEATQTRNSNELMHLFYTTEWPKSRIAELSKLVDRVNVEGDAIAKAILEQAGESLAALAGSLIPQLFFDNHQPQVSFAGGVFRSHVVHDRFQLTVERAGARCGVPSMNPSAGALLEAYIADGVDMELRDVPALK